MKDQLIILLQRRYNIKKTFSINFSKAKTKCCVSLHYNGDKSYLLINGKEIYKFKSTRVNFPTQFCLGNMSETFDALKSR